VQYSIVMSTFIALLCLILSCGKSAGQVGEVRQGMLDLKYSRAGLRNKKAHRIKPKKK